MAAGSANELDYHLLLSKDLDYLRLSHYQQLQRDVIEVRKMLASLIRKVEAERSAKASSAD